LKPSPRQAAIDKLTLQATRLPWWGALLSALAAYALLHPIAMLQMPAPSGMVDLVATSLAQLFVFIARVAQYLVPLFFLGLAAVSGFSRWKRRDLRDSVARDTTGSMLRGLTWPEFELLVAEAFRRWGFEASVPHSGRGGTGFDLELTRDGQRYLVDCNDWRSWRAGAGAVRKLHERVIATGARGGFAVTSGRFTSEAKHVAADRNVELIDGRHLKELVRSSPPAAQDERPPPIDRLLSLFGRWRARLAPDGKRAGARSDAREPVVQAAPDAQPAPGSATTRSETVSPGDDAIFAAGQELAALIREERSPENGLRLTAPRVQEREPQSRLARRTKRRIPARKVADAIGMLLAAGLLWAIYQWFVMLPAAPAGTPWSLLGTGVDADQLARRLKDFKPQTPGAEVAQGKRPLGQFQFGPPGRIADLQSQIPGQRPYGSLRELEAAFEARYVPPPECYAWESNSQMVKCGNHRIRTRREFIASGGEETAMLLGAWEDPSENWRPYDQWAQQHGEEWEEWEPIESGQQDQDWPEDEEARLQQQWRQDQALAPDQDWRTEDARRSGWVREQDEHTYSPRPQGQYGQGREELGDWRQDYVEDRRWERQWGDTRTQEPAPETGLQLPPQTGLQPEAPSDWRREFSRGWEQVEQAPPAPSQDWRQEWIRRPGPDAETNWQVESEPYPPRSSDQDWRQDWLRDSQPETEGNWRRDWETQPAPNERSHWVDGL
jgi:restriction system protein